MLGLSSNSKMVSNEEKILLIVTCIALGICFQTEAKTTETQTTLFQTTQTPPLLSLVCDFEIADICNFMQDLNDQFDWTRQRGPTPTSGTGPPVDHTTGTSVGYYMYAEASSPRNLGDTALLSSPMIVIDQLSIGCAEFYYYMDGSQVGGLKVYQQYANTDNIQRRMVWSALGSQGKGWQRLLIDLESTPNPFQILVEATIGSGHSGDIAIDDVSVASGSCPKGNMICDFEDPQLCGFGYDGTENIRFVRRAGSTTSSYTGPSNDHTYFNSTGYYIYMEASYARKDMLARIRSPVMAATTGKSNCLIFWYHMYGTGIGTLSVYMRNADELITEDPLWSKIGNRGDRWWAAEMDLQSDKDFVIVLETKASGNYRGDIAIDDVTFTGQMCSGEHASKNTSGVSCDFEAPEMCYYRQDKTDDGDWQWQNRATSDKFTGPDVDHTLGTNLGFYMVYTGDMRKPRQSSARLISPPSPPTHAASCLEFWYHMYGDDVETLNVYVVTVSYLSLNNPLWKTTGNQGNTWHRGTFRFPRRQSEFRVIFEALNGVRERDDVALDDVVLHASQNCPNLVTDTPSPTTRPEPSKNVDCDFETDWCGYEQAIDDIFDWTRNSGPTRSYGSGPNVDHTTGTAEGFYALMDCRNNYLRFDDRARLISPLLEASSSARCLRFFFYKYSRTAKAQDFLNIYIRQWGHRLGFDPDWSYFGVTPEGEWVEGWMEIPSSDEPMHIIFEGSYPSYKYNCDIALDDISIEFNSCPPDPFAPIGFDNIDCDFENKNDPLCGYEQGAEETQGTDNVNWIVKSGSTSTDGTGPNNDHTYGTAEGHYLYIEASQPQRPNYNAAITSPRLLNSFDHMCLQLYYHMSGKDTGWLRILQTVDNEETRELARISGQQEADWRPFLLDIPPVRGGMKISFEGQIGSGIYGDIAMDDIRTIREPCGGFPTEISCDFELGFDDCRYDFMGNDGFAQWTWFDFYSGNGPVEAVSGSYMYTSSSSGKTVASILSSGFKLTTVHCALFDYFIRGNFSRLQLQLESDIDDAMDLISFDEQTAKWTHAKIELNVVLAGYGKINFIGTTASGSIAVDSVRVVAGSCHDVQFPGTSSPTKGPFTGEKSKVGMIIGIIVAVVFVTVVAGGMFVYIRSRRATPTLNFMYKSNGDDSTITPTSTLSNDPGISNPNYEPSKLATDA